jgi:hypothetical protein
VDLFTNLNDWSILTHSTFAFLDKPTLDHHGLQDDANGVLALDLRVVQCPLGEDSFISSAPARMRLTYAPHCSFRT